MILINIVEMECSGHQKHKCHASGVLMEGDTNVAGEDHAKHGNSHEYDDGSIERAHTENSSSLEDLEASDDGIQMYEKPQSKHLPFSMPVKKVQVGYEWCIFKEQFEFLIVFPV